MKIEKVKKKAVRLLTRPRSPGCCCQEKPAAPAAQCCAKASPLVAGCHD